MGVFQMVIPPMRDQIEKLALLWFDLPYRNREHSLSCAVRSSHDNLANHSWVGNSQGDLLTLPFPYLIL